MAKGEIPTGRLVLAMALFLLVGAPIVLYDWYTIDEVFAGIVRPVPILIAAALGCVFLIFAAILGRYIRNLMALDQSLDSGANQ